jgi:hypothetical protein
LDCINSAKLLSIADYEPGKKLPAHISPFYEFSDDGHIKVDKKIVDYNSNEQITSKVNQNDEEKEDNELKEMLISKNKKKMLDRLREEQSKKKKVPKIKTNDNNNNKN